MVKPCGPLSLKAEKGPAVFLRLGGVGRPSRVLTSRPGPWGRKFGRSKESAGLEEDRGVPPINPLVKISIYRSQSGRRLYSISVQEGASEEEVKRLLELALKAESRLLEEEKE